MIDAGRQRLLFFFSSRRRHTRCSRDWSSDVCSSDLKEAFKALTQVVAQPAIAQSQAFLPILYLWAQNADFNGADSLAKIFKKMIPPELQDADPADKDAQLAQQAAALQQLMQQHQQMVAELARATDTIRTDRLNI